LASAITAEDDEAVTAAAQELDRVLRLASASIPRDTGGLLLGILEETQALREDLVDGLAAQTEGQRVRHCPVSV
jgi:hypothetical protein